MAFRSAKSAAKTAAKPTASTAVSPSASATSPSKISPTVSSGALAKKVVFEFYAPEARKVILAGSFNNWRTSEPTLNRDKNGKWSVAVDLPPGRYEYRYVVDGAWTNEQRPVERVANPFGSFNSVLEVK
jgi:1,4-alpha-glucan branching enzyme